MKNNTSYKHFVITRFNIKANFSCKLRDLNKNPMDLILDESYLDKRFRIFERFTLQSMKKQTNQNFTWIVLFHKKTPSKFIEKIQQLKSKFNFIDLYFDNEEKFSFLEYCNNEKENASYFITTRIDNDDMLDSEYIDKVQEYAYNNLHECILSFEHGMQYDLKSQKKYKHEIKNNHFLSMISTKEECILQYNHAKIFDSGKEIVMLDTDKPMWTEVIHESNVTNRIIA